MQKKSKFSTKSLTLVGMMTAITAILAATPLGLIPLPLASASTVHIPTLIVAILCGPFLGGVTGCALGLITLFRAATAPAGILDPYFINPIISVLPRILVGVSAGYSFRFLKKLGGKKALNAGVSAAIGSFVNTLGVMGLLYLIYVEPITAQIGEAAGPVFLGIVATSGTMEAIASAIITVAVVVPAQKYLPDFNQLSF